MRVDHQHACGRCRQGGDAVGASAGKPCHSCDRTHHQRAHRRGLNACDEHVRDQRRRDYEDPGADPSPGAGRQSCNEHSHDAQVRSGDSEQMRKPAHPEVLFDDTAAQASAVAEQYPLQEVATGPLDLLDLCTDSPSHGRHAALRPP